jgi:glucan biosynthesis protein C
MSKSRLFYIDNLRIFLISLVVLHHFIISYGAPGGWFYNESQAEFPWQIPMSMFVATNQAFFMGMFFFISSFFILPALIRKGNKTFIKERIIRLGIPLVIYYFLIQSITIFIRNKFIRGNQHSYFNHLIDSNNWGFGPMWFVEALLIFTTLFLIIRLIKVKLIFKFPGTKKILLAALLVGIGQFLIRIKMPVGTGHEFTNFQFPFFLQYIFLFPLGIIAYQNNWMDSINSRTGWRWFGFAQILIFIGFPAIFILGGALDGGTETFMGGFSWQCFAYATWEQFLCFSLIIGLFGIFKKKFNTQGNIAKKLSGSAYSVYVLHPPILVGINALFLNWHIPQLLKFIALSPIALIACFLIAQLVKQIPGIKKVM